ENFLAPIDPAKHPNWPKGLIGIGFFGLKQKLLGSIVAIAAISVLEWFVNVDINVDNVKLAWVVGILITFAVAMLILPGADQVSISRQHDSKNEIGPALAKRATAAARESIERAPTNDFRRSRIRSMGALPCTLHRQRAGWASRSHRRSQRDQCECGK